MVPRWVGLKGKAFLMIAAFPEPNFDEYGCVTWALLIDPETNEARIEHIFGLDLILSIDEGRRLEEAEGLACLAYDRRTERGGEEGGEEEEPQDGERSRPIGFMKPNMEDRPSGD